MPCKDSEKDGYDDQTPVATAAVNVRDGAALGTQIWVRFNSDTGPDQAKFKAVEQGKHPRCKPSKGGFWTAQWDADSGGGWVQWCLGEQFGVPEGGVWDVWLLEPEPDARVLVIDSYEDLGRVYARWPHELDFGTYRVGYPAWGEIATQFDAVHVTEEGQWRTRLTDPLSLYGWDCESTLWFRWAFADVQHIGPRTFEAT